MTRTKWLIGGLAVLNLVLAAGIAQHLHTPAARGQVAGAGGYLFASGQANIGGVVYVLNTNTGVISGIISQGNSAQNPVFIAPHSISADVKRILKR